MNKLRQISGDLRSSFWFLPSLMVLGSIVLATALIEADSAWSDPWLAQWPRLFGVGAEAAFVPSLMVCFALFLAICSSGALRKQR